MRSPEGGRAICRATSLTFGVQLENSAGGLTPVAAGIECVPRALPFATEIPFAVLALDASRGNVTNWTLRLRGSHDVTCYFQGSASGNFQAPFKISARGR